MQQGRDKGDTPLTDCEEGSSETLYRLTEKAILGGDSRVNLLSANYEGDDHLVGGARIGTNARDEESNSSERCDLEIGSRGGCADGDVQLELEGSDETLYRINADAVEVELGSGYRILNGVDDGLQPEEDVSVGIGEGGCGTTNLPYVAPLAEVGVIGLCDIPGNSTNSGSLSEATLFCINDTFVDGSRRSGCGSIKAIE
ncbi:hypothetical protein PIB30_024770 [Stylosanthes scabra]|uniref:Uncharacterized protein n=1 Tax=Stylosanthes scabra TaxID=79078 RepID=A0ABU6UBR0_9FABA|nr:hypothetical protein [Stylosanthes scabra]